MAAHHLEVFEFEDGEPPEPSAVRETRREPCIRGQALEPGQLAVRDDPEQVHDEAEVPRVAVARGEGRC